MSSRKTASETVRMESLLKSATTRRGVQTWVEKLKPEPLEYVRKLRAHKKKGGYVAYTHALEILKEEWGVAPSYNVFRKYIEGGYDHFLADAYK